MITKKLACLLFAITTLTACAEIDISSKRLLGGVLGAGAGGYVGSNFGGGKAKLVTTVIGALAGAFLGQSVGQSLDRVDELHLQNAIERNPTGTSSSWGNPDTGKEVSVTPTKTFKKSGRDCREVEMTVTVDGNQETATTTACRKPKGGWVFV